MPHFCSSESGIQKNIRYLFDAQVMSMMINFEEGREAVGMEAGPGNPCTKIG